MDLGKPMWRRSVPTSTTSSSPFLKRPTSPLVANGRQHADLVNSIRFAESIGLFRSRHRGRIFLPRIQHAGQFLQALFPEHFTSEQRNALHRDRREVLFDFTSALFPATCAIR